MKGRDGFTLGERVRIRLGGETGRFRGYAHSGFCRVRFRERGAIIDRVVSVADVERMPARDRASVPVDVTVECIPAAAGKPALYSIFLQQRGGDSPIAVAIMAPLEQATAAFREQLGELADLAKCAVGAGSHSSGTTP